MKMRYIFSLLFAMLWFVPMTYAQDPPLAFPSAEGFGKFAKGGRGGRVIEVTTLNCSGPGSFVEALYASGPRTIVFKVGGIIDCSNHPAVYTKNPYLTIAGQTAPGDGILVKGLPLQIGGNDIIIRYMRFRMGEKIASDPNSSNALGITAQHDAIVDHVSVSWATDDTAFSYADNFTWQRSIISEGLFCGVPNQSYCHGKGLGIGYNQPLHASVHHNLFANTLDRNPSIGSGTVDMINNVLHNVAGAPLFVPYWAPAYMNYVGNYYSIGPTVGSQQGQHYNTTWFLGDGSSPYATRSLVYANGNIHPTLRPDNSRPETDIMYFSNPPYVPVTTTRISTMSYPSETDAFKAYNDVLADVGDNKRLNADGTFSPRLGPVDTRIINEVKTGKGKFVIYSVNEVGGFPWLNNGTPYPDTDHDGMSDVWEGKYGFNLADSTDGSQDSDGDGYTNLEEFLNGTNPLLKNTSDINIDTTPPLSPQNVQIF